MKNIPVFSLVLAILILFGVLYLNLKKRQNLAAEVARIENLQLELQHELDSLTKQIEARDILIENLHSTNRDLNIKLRNERKKSADRVRDVRDATVEEHLRLFTSRTD